MPSWICSEHQINHVCYIISGEELADSFHLTVAYWMTNISFNKSLRVCIVNSAKKPLTLLAHSWLRSCKPTNTAGLGVCRVTFAPGAHQQVWLVIPDGKTFLNGSGYWMASQKCKSKILERTVPWCSERSIHALLWTLLCFAKVKDHSWEKD